jgi:hypothetical protein
MIVIVRYFSEFSKIQFNREGWILTRAPQVGEDVLRFAIVRIVPRPMDPRRLVLPMKDLRATLKSIEVGSE